MKTPEEECLYDFEDSIRLECISVHDAFELLSSSNQRYFVIGAGIRTYLPLLNNLGAEDIWQLLQSPFAGIREEFLKYPKHQRDNPHLMYAYVDWVLLRTKAHFLVFLPERNGILALGWMAGPTFDEFTQILERFPEYSDRIHFVTGLFSQPPEEL